MKRYLMLKKNFEPLLANIMINARVGPLLKKFNIHQKKYFYCMKTYWISPGRRWSSSQICTKAKRRYTIYIYTYLIIVIFFTLTKFLENKIYTQKARKLRQNTQKIANFLRYYGKIHSKLPIFRVKSVKIYTGQKKFTREFSWLSWQIWGMTEYKPLESQHPILTWEYTKVTSVLRFEDWSYKRHSPQPVESIQSPALSMVNTADSYLWLEDK